MGVVGLRVAVVTRRALHEPCTGNGDNMTGDESRKLKIGDRVRWKGDATNQGTVRGTSWSGVTIDWDDGDSTSVSHNDMTHVDRLAS
jgi:hypothetical protein